MRSAAVGHQCVGLQFSGLAATPRSVTAFGAPLRNGMPLVSYYLIAVNAAVFVMQLALARPGASPGAVAARRCGGRGHRPSIHPIIQKIEKRSEGKRGDVFYPAPYLAEGLLL